MQRILFFLLLLPLFSFANEKRVKVRFETTAGPFTVVLFNDTPLHRDNFLKLVNDGYYNGTKFHRVIANFMVQGGDPQTRNEAAATQEIGEGGPAIRCPLKYFLLAMLGTPSVRSTIMCAVRWPWRAKVMMSIPSAGVLVASSILFGAQPSHLKIL